MKWLPRFFQIFALLLVGEHLFGDVAVGAEVEFGYRIFVNPESLLESTTHLQTGIRPYVSVWTQHYELLCDGALVFVGNSAQPILSIGELKLTLNPFDIISLRLGQFNYLPGVAEFFSGNNFFSTTDYEILLSQQGTDYLLPSALIQSGIYLFDFYLLFTLSPFRQPALIPAVNSPWFPRYNIPQSITVQFPAEHEMVLDTIFMAEITEASFDLSQVSLSAELGGTLGSFDFSLLAYHGWDNMPLLSAQFDLEEGFFLSESYDVILTPEHSRIQATGINLASYYSSFRFWGEVTYTFAKQFPTNRLSSVYLNTAIDTSPYLEYCLGLSYESSSSFYNLFILGELKKSHILTDKDYYIQPLLGSALAGLMSVSLWDYRLIPSLVVIYSLFDNSFVTAIRFSYSPAEEYEVRFTYPFFYGGIDSELGQFQNNHQLALQLICRF